MVLIIGGHPRSGTTLLRDVVNGHPEISVTNEFACFTHIDRSWEECKEAVLRRWSDEGQRWAFDARCAARTHLSKCNLMFCTKYLGYLYQENLVAFEDIEKALERLFPGSRIVGDKLPEYVLSAPEMVGRHGVQALVIHRDCRDVTSSFLEMVRSRWRGQAWVAELNTAAKVAANWVKEIEFMERHREDLHIVRYEELIRTPESVFASIAKWLGVDASDFPIGQIRDTSIGKYKSGLTGDEVNDVMAVAGPALERLQYT